MKIAVIGGGAAGFFAAIQAKSCHSDAQVVLYERSNKVLSKVRISGGGRCNVTNDCCDVNELVKAYPRGGRSLKKVLHQFNTIDTKTWFETRGVKLYAQDDGRVFPVSNDSSSIIHCLNDEVKRLGINVKLNTKVSAILKGADRFTLLLNGKRDSATEVHKVVVATGGSPRRKGLIWLEELGHQIIEPIPSLFTFNMPGEPIRRLKGIAAEQVQIAIEGTKLKAEGPLLITHWGMSGPAVLKLSSFGARVLHGMGYKFSVRINWAGENSQVEVKDRIKEIQHRAGKKQLGNAGPAWLPTRLWVHLLHRWGLKEEVRWIDVGKREINKLVEGLTNDEYRVEGTTTFKEEFVTCGGVSLQSVNMKTMESKSCPGLFFCRGSAEHRWDYRWI